MQAVFLSALLLSASLAHPVGQSQSRPIDHTFEQHRRSNAFYGPPQLPYYKPGGRPEYPHKWPHNGHNPIWWPHHGHPPTWPHHGQPPTWPHPWNRPWNESTHCGEDHSTVSTTVIVPMPTAGSPINFNSTTSLPIIQTSSSLSSIPSVEISSSSSSGIASKAPVESANPTSNLPSESASMTASSTIPSSSSLSTSSSSSEALTTSSVAASTSVVDGTPLSSDPSSIASATSASSSSISTSSSPSEALTSSSSTVSASSSSSEVLTSSSLTPSTSAPAGITSSSDPSTITSTPSASSSCATTVPPPAPTQQGIVSGCSKWTVAVTGDYCITIANEFGLDVDTFMAWNPAVNPPQCSALLAGFAYCVEVCGDASLTSISTTLTTTPTTTDSGAAPTLTEGPQDDYTSYCGDGSVAQGWPSMEQWLDFDYLFEHNRNNMKVSCAQWGVPNDSDLEIANMKRSIRQIAQLTSIDARFILAIIMQESQGCVRVITTAYAHYNPGLMQSFNGTGTCNPNHANLDIPGVNGDPSAVQTPCPALEINQMILDGTNGTDAGPGLRQDFAEQGLSGARGYYRTAKLYNGGEQSFAQNANTLEGGCCTTSYVSDVANRLTGWVNAPRTFSCPN